MEMRKIIYIVLGIFLMFSSCVQEGPGEDELTGDGISIYFRSYLPSVSETRAGVITKETLSECQVTSINTDDFYLIDPATGEISPYFNDISFTKDEDGRFVTEKEGMSMWPDLRSRLHFFAYYPSVKVMRESIDNGKFKLVNYSKKSGNISNIDYRLESFKVAPDIANQVDFITAYSTGTQQDNGKNGVNLTFRHQLARIELSAWGASEKYDFEIAGVRIGNPLTEGDFNFSSLVSDSGEKPGWLNTAGKQSPVEHIFTSGESIVLISKDKNSHADKDNSASIMGKFGPAMVIPMSEKIAAWEGKDDPRIDEPHYTTNKLYFSVLLRVKNKNNNIVYPYPNDRDNIPVVYLAVGNDNKVSKRVYKLDGEYYTSDKKRDDFKYTGTEEIRAFCWAALPVGAKWEAGKIYTYKLNYTTGIGWQDPSDPNPGDPIIERGMVPFDVDVEEWVAAEGYDPNLDVPKR